MSSESSIIDKYDEEDESTTTTEAKTNNNNNISIPVENSNIINIESGEHRRRSRSRSRSGEAARVAEASEYKSLPSLWADETSNDHSRHPDIVIKDDLTHKSSTSNLFTNQLSTENQSNDVNSTNNNRIVDSYAQMRPDPLSKSTKSVILLLVSLTLLLDGMLNMVILPIIPEYLKYLPNNTDVATTTNPTTINPNSTTTTTSQATVTPVTFEYSRNDLAVGFLFATKPLIQLIVNPFSGTLIDHIGYKIPMAIGLVIQLASTLTFAFTDSFQLLFLARVLQGFGSALADTSSFSMVADCFKTHLERSKALGISITSLALGSFMSVPFSAFLFEYVSKKAPFIALSIFAFLALCMLACVTRFRCSNWSREANDDEKKKTRIWNLFLDPYIAICAWSLVMANLPLAFTEPAIAVWMKKTLKSTESQIGLIWLSGFLPHLTGVYLVVWLVKRCPNYQFVFIMAGLLFEALSCLWIPFITNYYVLFIPICVICFGYGMIDATILPTMAYLVDTRHASLYGSVYAIVDISYSSVYCFGPIISGLILQFIGFIGMSIILCCIICSFVPFVYLLKRIYFLKALDDSAAARLHRNDSNNNNTTNSNPNNRTNNNF